MPHLRYAILGLLLRAPSTGYELGQIFRTNIKYLWDAKQSQIYPELNRLFDDGLADYYHDVKGEALTRKRFFCTEKGEAEFRAWLNEVPVTEAGSTAELFFLKLQFCDLQTPAQHRDFIHRTVAEAAATAARIRACLVGRMACPPFGHPEYNEQMIWRWALAREEAFLAWLRDYEKEL